MIHPSRFAILPAILLLPVGAWAAEPPFSDLSDGHFAYEAVEYLSSKNIVKGYNDGSFRPNQIVNRAEALKFIIAPLVQTGELEIFTTSQFADVPEGSWFLPYVEAGRVKKVIDSPPVKTAFLPSDPVIKVEFLKMLQLAHNENPIQSFSEIRLPLSNDVTDVTAWYYPYTRFALTASLLTIMEDGNLHPAKQLTRAETAVIIYRMLMYTEGRRTEDLLALNETETQAVLAQLESNNTNQAILASARALLYSRGAHLSSPNEPIVVATLKLTEGFRALVRAHEAMEEDQTSEAIRLSKDAWQLADLAKKKANDVVPLAERVQDMAAALADEARQ